MCLFFFPLEDCLEDAQLLESNIYLAGRPSFASARGEAAELSHPGKAEKGFPPSATMRQTRSRTQATVLSESV